MKKTTIIVGIIIAFVAGLVGGYFGGYAEGGAAVTALYASKIAAVGRFFPMPSQVFSLSGRVENISGDTITIDANSITQNPFAEGNFPAVRTVAVTGATVITRMEQTDFATLQKEMAAQRLSASTGTVGAPITPPSLFTETDIVLSDIKVGDMIMVTAASDIANAASFSATKIQLLPENSANVPFPSSSVPAATQTPAR